MLVKFVGKTSITLAIIIILALFTVILYNNQNIKPETENNMLPINENNISKPKFSSPEYNCTICNGFCYAQSSHEKQFCFNKKIYSYTARNFGSEECEYNSNCHPGFKCINNSCIWDMFEDPYNIPIKITPTYEESIPINTAFDIRINIKNNGNTNQKITLDNVLFSAFAHFSGPDTDTQIDHNETLTIAPNDESAFTIRMEPSHFESYNAAIFVKVIADSIEFILEIGPLIIYNPELEAQCGEKKYNEETAVCINDILYPTYYGACESNDECPGNSICLDYFCYNQIPLLNPDKKYNVEVLPIFIIDDNNSYNETKLFNLRKLDEILSQANNWFKTEKEYWSTDSNFLVNFTRIQECRLTKSQYISILGKQEDNTPKQTTRAIISFCNTTQESEIIAIHEFWDEDLYDQELFDEMNRVGFMGVAGINYGEIIVFGLDYGVLIHETLHSFGEIDIYPNYGMFGSDYQWRDCNLFKAYWAEFKNYPHLCSLEAKIIGWKS